MSTDNQRALIKKLENAINQDTVHLKGTVKTPEIYLNKSEGLIQLEGRSIPENAKQLYNPILTWSERYIKSPMQLTKLVFKLEYFNTASSKMIYELINIFKGLQKAGRNIKIEWHYLVDDDDILDSGETFQEISGLEFNFYPYE